MFQKCEIAYSRVSLISVLVSKETLQALQIFSRSLFDCQSLTLNVIRLSQFVRNSQLCHKIGPNVFVFVFSFAFFLVKLCPLILLINCQKGLRIGIWLR